MSEPNNETRSRSVVDLAAWRAAHGRNPPRREAPEPPPSGPPTALLDGVCWVRSGKRLLDHVTLAIGGPGVSAVIGPNGAGKSVMLRLIARLLTPTEGVVAAPQPGKGGSAIVFQKPVLLRRTLRGNLAHALRLAGVPRRERPTVLEALLAAGGLNALADRPARALSGGEQQRVAMMRALAFRPRLLLLDEPSANLDPHATAAIEALIRGASDAGVKVLLVTHDLGQARRLASEIIVLDRGRVAEQTPTSAFFERPASEAGLAYREGRLHF